MLYRWPLLTGLSIAAMAVLASPPALAQSESAAPPTCNAATAEQSTIAAITAAGNTMHGRCVTVEGIALGPRLYADDAARYRPQTIYNDPSSSGAVIGLYANTRQNGARRVRVTGRVDSCAAMQAAADQRNAAARTSQPENLIITMLSGFCHYYHGLVIAQATTTPVSRGAPPLTRIPRGAAGWQVGDIPLGNLSTMASGEERQRFENAGMRLITAVLERELAIRPDAGVALATMLRPLHGGQRSDAEIASLTNRLTAAGGVFDTHWIGNGGRPVFEILGWREPPWADEASRAAAAQRMDAGVREGFFCASTARDAAALWPIDEGDIDNHRSRPYACVRITLRPDGSADHADYDVPQTGDWHPPEPRA